MMGVQASTNSSRVGYAPVEWSALHMRLPTVYGEGMATMIFESVCLRMNSISPAAIERRVDILEVTAGYIRCVKDDVPPDETRSLVKPFTASVKTLT